MSKKILIVDDEKEVRETLSEFFELEGLECIEAENGPSGLQMAKEHKPDFIITDVRMPGGDGIDLLKDVRKMNPELPVVLVMTGFAETTEDEVKKLGGLDLIPKPLDLNNVLEVVKKHLDI